MNEQKEIVTTGPAGDERADVAVVTPLDLAVLPPMKRAAVALDSKKAEKQLRDMVSKTAAITNVVDANGREEAHRAAMGLKNARVSITKTGKGAREDAKTFCDAVIAEEKRLIDIVIPEEGRLFLMRDDYDEKVAREKAEKERIEAERKSAIKARIANITMRASTMAGATSEQITAALAELAQVEVTEEAFAEFRDEAAVAVETTASALLQLRNAAREREEAAAAALLAQQQEQARLKEQAEIQCIENERLAAERARLDAERAENERLHEEQQKRAAQEIRAMSVISEIQHLGMTEGSATELQAAIDAVAARPTGDLELGIGAGMAKMAQRMALDALRPRYEQAVIKEAAEVLQQVVVEEFQPDPGLIEIDFSQAQPVTIIVPHDVAILGHLVDAADVGIAMEPDGAEDSEIVRVVAEHFGWSFGDAARRMQAVDFSRFEVPA